MSRSEQTKTHIKLPNTIKLEDHESLIKSWLMKVPHNHFPLAFQLSKMKHPLKINKKLRNPIQHKDDVMNKENTCVQCYGKIDGQIHMPLSSHET